MPLPFTTLLSSAVAAVTDRVPSAVTDAVPAAVMERVPGTRHVWRGEGRAHVEARGITDPAADELRQRLTEVLDSLEGVNWAEVNALTGRVAVDYDPGTLDANAVVRLVREAEAAETERTGTCPPRDAPAHPADADDLLRNAVTIAADALGVWLALIGRLARITPIPIELGSLVSLVENQPRVRALLERRLGAKTTDLLLGVSAAMANGAAQGPVGLLVDIAHRAGQVSEVAAHRRTWAAREPELYANPRPSPVEPAEPVQRPVPLPNGPVEIWSDRITTASGAAAVATLAATRSPRRAADALLAGMPKAARLGREAFAAQIGRSFAARGIVVLDREALRRLDRLDTVVIDAAALLLHTWHIAAAWSAGDHDEEEVHRRAAGLLDIADPDRRRRSGTWALGPFADAAGDDLPRGAKTRARELRRGGRTVLALRHRGALAGLVAVTPDVEPGAHLLAEVARRAELRLLVAGDRAGLAAALDADGTVNRTNLPETVQRLQADGAVVAVVARQARTSLRAADVGIGLTRRRSGRPPWAADLVCGRDLRDAAYVLDAAAVAREVSRRSAWLALAGSSAGALLAYTGSGARAGHRVLTAVNGAAATAIVAGMWSGVRLARRPRPALPDATPWHALDVEEVLDRLEVDAVGLSTDEAAHRLRSRGGQRSERAAYEAFLEELANPLTPILGVGAGLSALAGSAVDAAIVGSLIGLNTLVGGIQRLHTERAVSSLLRSSSLEATVLRDGDRVRIPADELVPGDVVTLVSGDAVPADCRVLEAEGVEVDESSLTGESMPVAKSASPRHAAPVAERSSMLYEGTTIAAGRAVAVVVATDEATEAGSALAQVADAEPVAGGVEERLAELSRSVLPIAGVAAAGITAAGLLRGWTRPDIVGSAVNLAVASVPEGLPFLATGAQIAAARRLAERGAIVRTPRAMEALGRVDVLCFDKTGTLTEGRIAVAEVSDGTAAAPLDDLSARQRAVLGAALRACPDGNGGLVQHATDRAVLGGGSEAGVEPEEGLPGWARTTELPFEPGRGLSAGLGRTADGMRLSVKGAPEVVLERCSLWRSPDGRVTLDDATRRTLTDHFEELARQGYRVLAVAEREASDRSELDDDRVDDLELLGLLALADPIRRTAAEAVRNLRDAGVDIVMVTGDHPTTAEAIAAKLGILGDDGLVVTGADLDDLGEEELAPLLERAAVFARVTPGQKVRIVQAFQRAGRTVSMTGDGANDAPSIRLADVGVALGERSTPAAREAADLVVTDDRIETIIDAIVEGRAMWSSVRDALSILVGGNLGEIGFTVGASMLSRRPPLSTRQLLLVNLMTDLFPAMAIAVQPPVARDTEVLLREGPDRSLGEALRRQVAIRAVATGAAATGAFAAARVTGITARRASTVALLGLVGAQLGQTLTAGKGNTLVTVTALGSAGLLVGVVQTPGISHFFGCTPVGPVGWMQAGAASVLATGGAVIAERTGSAAETGADERASLDDNDRVYLDEGDPDVVTIEERVIDLDAVEP
jgi:cation-transporting P-type ATPase I